jgi:antitoxin component YwqK of YwqJK toxin-antitoxin module
MNKKSISALIFMLFSLVLFAQQEQLNQTDKNGKKQGKWIKKDEHGKPIYKGVFKEGKPTGEFNYYYDTGDIQTTSFFYNNGAVCKTKHYFPGNILMAEGKYINQKRDSIWKFYNAPNALVSEESFKNGKKDGFEKNYDGKGKLMEEKNWKDSILNGFWKKYYEDGTIQQEGFYNTGFLEGDMKFYYPGKVPAAVGQYQHSLREGKWTYYDRGGKIITHVENYHLGDLHGYFAEWSEKDNTPKLKGEYKQGKRNGKWIYFDEKGKLAADTTFLFGYLHGVCTEYYENGNKKSESNYYYSHKTGKWTEWNEEGKATKEDVFDSIDSVKKKMALEEKEKKLPADKAGKKQVEKKQ